LDPISAQLPLGPVKTSFLWGWWDPVLLGSGRDPIAFGMAKAQLPLEQPRPSSFGQSRHNFFEGWS